MVRKTILSVAAFTLLGGVLAGTGGVSAALAEPATPSAPAVLAVQPPDAYASDDSETVTATIGPRQHHPGHPARAATARSAPVA